MMHNFLYIQCTTREISSLCFLTVAQTQLQSHSPLITTEEQAELTDLIDLHDRVLWLKSEATAEAVRRGVYEAGSEA
jgi:hypothetical protein